MSDKTEPKEEKGPSKNITLDEWDVARLRELKADIDRNQQNLERTLRALGEIKSQADALQGERAGLTNTLNKDTEILNKKYKVPLDRTFTLDFEKGELVPATQAAPTPPEPPKPQEAKKDA